MFGRFGRPDAEGAFATCHCLTLPESEPGYYFWRDRATGELTRRSEWFVTKSPTVRVGATPIKYLISFVLPRFCDQSLERSRKADLYPGAPPMARQARHHRARALSHRSGRRRASAASMRADGTDSARSHGPQFYEDVAEMVNGVSRVESGSRAATISCSTTSRADRRATAAWSATTFRNFPSFPQRYMERLEMPAAEPQVRDRAAQAADAAGALHRRRSPHPPVHREQHAPDPQGPAPRRLAAAVSGARGRAHRRLRLLLADSDLSRRANEARWPSTARQVLDPHLAA